MCKESQRSETGYIGFWRSEGCLKEREPERRMCNVSVAAILAISYMFSRACRVGETNLIHLERRREALLRQYS